jgi:hypothetical protein
MLSVVGLGAGGSLADSTSASLGDQFEVPLSALLYVPANTGFTYQGE